jgi:hypothetical protein
MPRPHWRKMTWVLIVWCALILLWAIVGGASNNCSEETTQLNQNACEAGTGIGVAIILLIGFFGFVFLWLIWFMTRPRGRICPVCGEIVKTGLTACPKCGHDFAAAAGQQAIDTRQAAVAGATGGAPPPTRQVPPGWFPDPNREARERYWDGRQWTEHLRGGAAR